jgi:hypothetical protein
MTVMTGGSHLSERERERRGAGLARGELGWLVPGVGPVGLAGLFFLFYFFCFPFLFYSDFCFVFFLKELFHSKLNEKEAVHLWSFKSVFSN